MKLPPSHFTLHANLTRRIRLFTLSVCAVMLMTLPPMVAGASLQGAQVIKVKSVEFVGLKRYDAAAAVKATGLRLGQSIAVAEIDRLAQKLLKSGYFSKVGYTTSRGAAAAIVFRVEESRAGVPVVFDNFVWFTTAELTDAIRKDVPLFDGTLPESGDAVETVKESLQQMLAGRARGGQVEYNSSADTSGKVVDYNFSVMGVRVPTCALKFPGASGIGETELVKNSQSVFDESYSQAFARGFADANLIPLYRQRGYLRARFDAPAAMLAASEQAQCKDGVTVSIPVEEGIMYSWERAEWDGALALTPDELNARLAMRAGDVADGVKFDANLAAVRKAYGERGFIAVKLAPAPIFDDANKRVAYRIAVTEGAQYRMGEFIVRGLPDADAARLRQLWKLAPGAIFNASYTDEFLRASLGKVVRRAVDMGIAYKPDRERKTVDVVLEIK